MTTPTPSHMVLHYAALYFVDQERPVPLAATDSPVETARKDPNVQYFQIEYTRVNERTGDLVRTLSEKNYIGTPFAASTLRERRVPDTALLSFLDKNNATFAVQTRDGEWHVLGRNHRVYCPKTGDILFGNGALLLNRPALRTLDIA